MNARTDTLLMTIVPERLTPSRTKVQALRRARFNPIAITEMADSMRDLGVLEPILARELGDGKLEIVAGERRWRAAQQADLKAVPVLMRELTDAQVLRVQVIENIQRDDYLPLEEAAGYAEILATDPDTNADALAAAVGKSRAYIYARIKLLQLIPEAQAALQDGTLDASKGLLLARFKSPKLQAQALKMVGNTDWYSFRRTVEKLRDDFTIRLDKAPFSQTDDGLTATLTKAEYKSEPFMGACTGCPHNSANDTELQRALDDAAGTRDAVLKGRPFCIHTPCFELKTREHNRRAKEAAIAAGATILTGDQARRALPDEYDHGVGDGYLELDAQCDEDFDDIEPYPDEENFADEAAYSKAEDDYNARAQAFEARTYRQILGDTAPTVTVFAEDPKTGALRELAPLALAAKALKKAGYEHHAIEPIHGTRGAAATPEDRAAANAAAAKEQAREHQRALVEHAWRVALLKQVHAKYKGPLKKPDLVAIADFMQERGDDGDTAIALGMMEEQDGELPNLDKMSETDLQRYIIALLLSDCLGTYSKPDALVAAAKRLRIDPAKVKKDVQAEIKKAAKAGGA